MIALKIDENLEAHIPPSGSKSPAALCRSAIAENRLTSTDPSRDRLLIKDTPADIEGKTPTLVYGLEVGDVTNVHRQVKHYRKLKGGDPFRFPKIGVLGHREDENRLLVDGTRASGGSARTQDQKNALLKYVNEELNKLVPHGAYFNTIHQRVIDVVGSASMVSGWVKRDDEIREMRTAHPERFLSTNTTTEPREQDGT